MPSGLNHYRWKARRNINLYISWVKLRKQKDAGEDISIQRELVRKFQITSAAISGIINRVADQIELGNIKIDINKILQEKV